MERDMGGSSQVAVIIVRLTKEETVTRLYRVFFIFFIIFLEFFFSHSVSLRLSFL